MYYVYVIRSLINGQFYTGRTVDIERRLNEHNHGKGYFTKRYKPWILVHVEIVNTSKEARKLEKYFKSGYGREIIKEIDRILTN